MFFERANKKGSHSAAFFILRTLIFPGLDHKKKRAGRGGSARTGKSLRGVNSKERVRSRIHLQAQRNFLSAHRRDSSLRNLKLRAIGLPGIPDQLILTLAGPEKSGHCSGFLQNPLLFKALAAGSPRTKRWSVNALWGKLPRMAVTKCIVLQVDERLANKKPAF